MAYCVELVEQILKILPQMKSSFLSEATMVADELLKDIVTVNAAVNACEKVGQATFVYHQMNTIQWVWKSCCYRDSDILCEKNESSGASCTKDFRADSRYTPPSYIGCLDWMP